MKQWNADYRVIQANAEVLRKSSGDLVKSVQNSLAERKASQEKKEQEWKLRDEKRQNAERAKAQAQEKSNREFQERQSLRNQQQEDFNGEMTELYSRRNDFQIARQHQGHELYMLREKAKMIRVELNCHETMLNGLSEISNILLGQSQSTFGDDTKVGSSKNDFETNSDVKVSSYIYSSGW